MKTTSSVRPTTCGVHPALDLASPLPELDRDYEILGVLSRGSAAVRSHGAI